MAEVSDLDAFEVAQGAWIVSVLIVCVTRLVREGLERTLVEYGVRTVGSTGDLRRAALLVRTLAPDVVLAEPAALNCRAASLRLFAATNTFTRVILLGATLNDSWLEALVEGQGRMFCVREEASTEEAIIIIKDVAPAHWGTSRPIESRPEPLLTVRQREVIELVSHGLSNKEIGQLLSIEIGTVKNHVHTILDKLGLARRGQIAPWLRSDRHIPSLQLQRAIG
jgi:DNA-binding NarL/FixJ family response regulator